MTSLDAMREHIESLLARHDIDRKWIEQPEDAQAIREIGPGGVDNGRDEVLIAPICDAISYAIALHEIGHILGRYQLSWKDRVRERWAWQWARENALVWSSAMDRHAKRELEKNNNAFPG
jgi:hypothetical protein